MSDLLNSEHAKEEIVLLPNEKILGRGYISYGIYWKAVALLLFAIILGGVAGNLGLFMLLVSFITFFVAYLRRQAIVLLVTDQRIVLRNGWFKVDALQMRYSQTESVEVRLTPGGFFFKYAVLVISGTGSRVVFVPYLGNAALMQNLINARLAARDAVVEVKNDANRDQ